MRTYPENEIIVSVILITYNHEKYVRQAIESILSQKTNFKFEILVGDDCSTDNTPGILKEYGDKYSDNIKLFLRKKNLGATKNDYLLKKQSVGKYIAPLEGDDYWLNNDRLQNMIDFLENCPQYIGISHKRERRDIKGNLLGYDPSEDVLNKPFTVWDFLNGNRCSVFGAVYRNFYLDSGEKYEIVCKASRNVADFSIIMILLDLGDLYVTDRCFGVFRVRNGPGESNYNSMFTQLEMYFDHIKLIRVIDSFFLGKYDFTKECIGRQFNALLFCIKRKMMAELKMVMSTISFKEWIFLFITLPIKLFGRLDIYRKR